MKYVMRIFFLIIALAKMTPIYSQESSITCGPPKCGDSAGYSTRDASALSMMGWGVGLAVGIALLCGYLDHDSGGGNAHASSNSSDNNSTH